MTAPRPPSVEELAEAVGRWRLAESGPRPGSVELPYLEPRVSLEVLRDAVTAGGRCGSATSTRPAAPPAGCWTR